MTIFSPEGLSDLLITLFVFDLPAILFLIAQQKTLEVIRTEYRELRPGLVWLQLIPVFNLYWMFVVVTRIADSISRELVARQDDSILGVPNFDAVQSISHRPTYKIGMAWCLLYISCPLVVMVTNVSVTTNSDAFFGVFAFIMGALLLAALVCWIIYWIRLVENRRKLQKFRY